MEPPFPLAVGLVCALGSAALAHARILIPDRQPELQRIRCDLRGGKDGMLEKITDGHPQHHVRSHVRYLFPQDGNRSPTFGASSSAPIPPNCTTPERIAR